MLLLVVVVVVRAVPDTGGAIRSLLVLGLVLGMGVGMGMEVVVGVVGRDMGLGFKARGARWQRGRVKDLVN